jgi:tetratricopeptide (TPR) repeat protein
VRQSSSNAGEKFRKALAHHGRQFEKYSTIGKGKGKTAAYWLNTIMAHLRYGSIGKAVSLFDKTKHITQSHPDFAKVKRYKTLMDGKEQPPRLPPPPPKSDKKRYRLYHLLNQARLAYNKDKEEKCIYLLGEPETTKWFVDAYPHVLFYLGSCSRFSDDYIDALKYFEKFLQHPKVKVSWSRPQTTPKKPTTRPSQPLKR